MGVSLIPMVEAHLPLPPNLRVISLGEATFYREIGLLQRKPRATPPIVAQFAQCLRESSEEQGRTANSSTGAGSRAPRKVQVAAQR